MKILKLILVLLSIILTTNTINAQMQLLSGQTLSSEDLKKLEKEAKKGDISLQAGLASVYSQGIFGVNKDLKKALSWAKKAYETGEKQGNPIGIVTYLSVLITNENDIPNAKYDIISLGAKGDLTNNPYCLFSYGGWLLTKGEINDGLKRINQAANLGNVESMNLLATLYLGEEGVPVNHELAFKWASKSAEFGNPQGMRNLVNFYANGIGTEKDVKKAMEWGEKAKDAGIDCSDLLYVIYLESDNYEDQKKGFNFLYANQNAPDPSVWRVLGICYENGIGIDKDEAMAVQWYELASQGEDEDAICRLVDAKLNGSLGIEQDIETAIAELNEIMEQGSVQAFYSLEDWYFKKNDGASLIKLYTKVIDNIDKFPNISLNQMNWQLAGVYEDKKMGVKDIENQKKYLRAITDATTPEYHVAQGLLLFDKQFGEPNYEKAIKHFEWVIQKKDEIPLFKREAYKKLASAYRYGRGVEVDEVKADEYLHQQELIEQEFKFAEYENDYVKTTDIMRNLGL